MSGFEDFTEAGYRRLLALAARAYAFEFFGTASEAPHVLMRHDVDNSPHRARALARIEAEMGARATYFWLFRSDFYNLMEPSVRALVRETVALGHAVGLHFDVGYHADATDAAGLERRVAQERELLADIAGAPVIALSYHQPTTNSALNFRQDRIAGLVSAYGAGVFDRYKYVSDSNGYWRHDDGFEILARAEHPRVQVLIHPEWWTPEPMSPRARVQRALQGRLEAVATEYDAFLDRWGRENRR